MAEWRPLKVTRAFWLWCVEGLDCWAVTRETRDMREQRDPKFEVGGSKFQKPRTSDLEPSSVSFVPPVSRGYPAGSYPVAPVVQTIEVLLC
jgi:hypothetical protein